MEHRYAAFRASNRQALVAVGLLVAVILLGGGGTPSPLMELWVQMLAGLAALAWLWLSPPDARLLPRGAFPWVLALLVALLPALQLVPLPPAIWTTLPGREVQVAALQLVGEEESWRPISLSPPRTLASLLSLFPPLLLLLMTAALAPEKRRWLIAAIAGMAILSALFGAVQLAAGPAAPRLYAASHEFVVTGFQANRNSTADVLLIGLVALAATALAFPQAAGTKPGGERTPRTGGWWLGGLGLLLCLGTVLTASRTGIALLPVALLACWFLLRRGGAGRARERAAALAAGFLAAALAGAFLLRNNTALKTVAARFDFVGVSRLDIWADSLFVVQQYWPFGAGMGTFIPSYAAAERLEAVDPTLTNRAHNDYLELAVEAGAFGLLILALVAALLAFSAIQASRRRARDSVQLVFGGATLLIVAAHSMVDYPLRSIALASLAAVAAGMFAAPPGSRETGNDATPAPE